jgi:hypothetical protein
VNNGLKRWICLFTLGIGIANFAAFFAASLYLGGDAINGKMAAGHFYLMGHGRYTEVSESVFAYSKWHAYSTWLTHPLAFIAACLYYRIERKPPN